MAAKKAASSANYWLMKSEPHAYSIQDLAAEKTKTTHWDGVRNYQAANYMKQMKKGDECLFYSSISEKAIKGIMTVVKEYYPDHTDKKGIFGMVDVKYVKDLKEVTLAEIKADPFFDDFFNRRKSSYKVKSCLLYTSDAADE